ncbi:hypothetical protein TcasGA2_TC016059 [Tribolium castaneum]|uniref:Uncharacterized protein n=1 Tax=Tribolium castaneum TaxID=7070 RepID=D6W6T1_TRICA|nr:hypothetical protein TcasGA2_TC016059 [Tribolium castaneum]
MVVIPVVAVTDQLSSEYAPFLVTTNFEQTENRHEFCNKLNAKCPSVSESQRRTEGTRRRNVAN